VVKGFDGDVDEGTSKSSKLYALKSLETADPGELALSRPPSRATNLKDARSSQSVESHSVERFPLFVRGYGARSLLNNLEDLILEEVVLRSESCEDLSGTHRIAHHGNFLLLFLIDKVDGGLQVILAHVGPAEVPEFGRIRRVVLVRTAVLGSAGVEHPLIVASV